ncbi:unnamed protein product [Cuscuta epithymum]|uniref:FAD dependent oxidoreductase domain-containing protein n=1 Tax=Cuscuta epithymum TaxID=186058 RepID=A0AAV0CUJ2_9ASTE|nr:unnamed protein product [Cuscuta epithymum]CAH9136097.1 unnamed protein product [Cuscuta epithymum]
MTLWLEEGVYCYVVRSTFLDESGILRPAHSVKNMEIMIDNAQKGLPSCRIERIDKEAAHELIPGLYVPLDLAFHMPQALTVNSQCYLKALYSACQLSAKESPNSGGALKELRLHKKPINRLLDLAGEYDAVIICLGARAAFLPELSGRIPLRTCRGIIAHLKVDDDVRDGYPADSPSILSDAWIAFHGPQDLRVGATWDWNSRNYSRGVSREEGNKAIEELLHRKASAMYPAIKNMTTVTGMSGGLRAVPPLTPQGSLPLLGCVDEFVSGNQTDNKFWLLTGLGSRGLLYHGWVGKLMARAVLSRDEGLIPYELISWKSII